MLTVVRFSQQISTELSLLQCDYFVCLKTVVTIMLIFSNYIVTNNDIFVKI